VKLAIFWWVGGGFDDGGDDSVCEFFLWRFVVVIGRVDESRLAGVVVEAIKTK
jgi:hypothetical protein